MKKHKADFWWTGALRSKKTTVGGFQAWSQQTVSAKVRCSKNYFSCRREQFNSQTCEAEND